MTVDPSAQALRIVVTVGSDHHPFDRLIGWVDDWLAAQGGAVETVWQYGTARKPAHGRAEAFLPHDALQDLLERADVVVTQGGPMGIVEARRHGVRPVVVPRLARLGEVVDDHQVTFCRHLAGRGEIALAEDAETLSRELDRAITSHQVFCIDPSSSSLAAEEAVRKFSDIVASLPARRRRHLRRQ